MLLVRRGLADPTDRAYYVCFCRAETALTDLVRAGVERTGVHRSVGVEIPRHRFDSFTVEKMHGPLSA